MRGRFWVAPILAGVLAAGSGGWFAGAAAGQAATTCQAWGAQPVNVTADTELRAVAVTSSCNAWAAGDASNGSTRRTVIEHWNGTAWQVQASPDPGGVSDVLDGIAAASSSRAWAVGSSENASVSQTLIAYWNGMAWKVQASPNVGTGDNFLVAATATSGTNAWAVGHYHTGTHDQTLIEHWNGVSWKRVPSPNPAGSTSDNLLFGVAATSATSAWAVGYHDNGTAVLSLVEHWNGTSWKVVPSPSAGTADNFLWSVDATSATNAWAVGWYQTTTGGYLTLFERWNGTAWRRVPTPGPGGPGNTNTLWGVAGTSCGNAWAVGYYSNGTGNTALALHC